MSDACRDCLRCGEWTGTIPPAAPPTDSETESGAAPDEDCSQCGHPLLWHALAGHDVGHQGPVGEAIPDEPWPDADLH